MAGSELKPIRCRCGGEAIYGKWVRKIGVIAHAVGCKNCGIQTKPYPTEAEAIEAWNKAMGAKDINVPNKERKKGHWSNYKDEHCCSVCHCVVIQDNWDDDIRYDFCPYCGAEMTRGEE